MKLDFPVSVHVWAHMCYSMHAAVRRKPAMWVPGIELAELGLVANTFNPLSHLTSP